MYTVYVLTSVFGKAMYIGVTNDLQKRVHEHKTGMASTFTKKYNITKLVYFEQTSSIESAILREKQLKSWRREKKNKLVEMMNPNWEELKI